MTNDEIIRRLHEIADIGGGGCLCGRGEWCERCTPGSATNRTAKALAALIDDLGVDAAGRA